VKAFNTITALIKRGSGFPLLLFSQELRALINAGLSVVEALDVLTRKETRAETRNILQQISKQLHEACGVPRTLCEKDLREGGLFAARKK
jgi:general secretion pathway protein F